MKKIFLSVAIIAALFTPAFAQQSTTLSPILTAYFQVKDALIAGNADLASANAAEMVKAIDAVDMKQLSQAEHKTFMAVQPKLAIDARHIAEVKKIDHQREHFATLSNNLYTLAKSAHLSSDPVYRQYCPMKKSYWLSPEQAVKNPYYGDMMPECGKVTETIKP